MTEKQKYLIGFVAIASVLVAGWYWISAEDAKGEPEKSASPSVSSGPSQETPSQEPPSSSPNSDTQPSQPDLVNMEETRKVAEQFLRAYLSFDGKHTEKHLEEAKPYMTESLYQDMTRQLPRPTASIQSQRLVKVTHADGVMSGKNVEWSIQAITEVTDGEGNKRKEEWTYVVTLTNDGGWKVEEVTQRGLVD